MIGCARVSRLTVVGLSLIALLTVAVATRDTSARQEPTKGSAAKKKTRGKKKATPAKPAASTAPAEASKPAPSAATADDSSLKFTRDIAPVLVANCMTCHNAEKHRGDFDMSSFDKLIKGSKAGKVLIPGKPDESPLVLHIKGEEPPKMPPGNNNNLAAATIAKIEEWVKAGAILDSGADPMAMLSKIAATPESLRQAALSKLTPAERDQKSIKAGIDRWKKANVQTKPETTPGDHFLLLSNLSESRSKQVLKDMEKEYNLLKTMLSRPGKPALEFPEKIGLYVFKDRIGYVEFVRTIENREIDDGVQADANLGVESPYVAAVDPLAGRDDFAAERTEKRSRKKSELGGGPERTLSALLTEQLAFAATNQAGKPPRWLSLGLGAFLGSKLEPRSPYYRRLRVVTVEQQQLGWISKVNDALGGQTEDDKVRAIGFSLIEWLASAFPSQYPRFVRGMLEGQEKLDDGIGVVFNSSREQFLNAWEQWVVGHYGQAR